jgi:hypothetical protein
MLRVNGPVGQIKASPKILLVYIPSTNGCTQHYSCSWLLEHCSNFASTVQIHATPHTCDAHMAVAQCSQAVGGPGADKV